MELDGKLIVNISHINYQSAINHTLINHVISTAYIGVNESSSVLM